MMQRTSSQISSILYRLMLVLGLVSAGLFVVPETAEAETSQCAKKKRKKAAPKKKAPAKKPAAKKKAPAKRKAAAKTES